MSAFCKPIKEVMAQANTSWSMIDEMPIFLPDSVHTIRKKHISFFTIRIFFVQRGPAEEHTYTWVVVIFNPSNSCMCI